MNGLALVATTFLSLLLNILPKIGVDSAAVTNVINTLASLVPILIQEAKDVLPLVRNVIDLLKSEDVTDEQLAQLDALSVAVDSAWDQAVDDFEKGHPDE